MIDDVSLATLRLLIASGAIVRKYADHSWPGCDGRLTCACPVPPYSYQVAPEYRDALEGERSA